MTSKKRRLAPFSVLTLALAALSLVGLWVMTEYPIWVPVAFVVGALAFTVDLLLEYFGVRTRRWNYDMGRSVGGVPLIIPLFFLFAGLLATLSFYILNAPEVIEALREPVGFLAVTLLQSFFLALAVFFLLMYALRPKEVCLAFGTLPLAFALYVEFNQPWMLLVALLSVYVDFYVEKLMVKKGLIAYVGGNSSQAHLVALTYFATTLLLLGVIGLLARYMFGFDVRGW